MVKCDVCDEEFMQNIQLKIHKRLHADLRSMVNVIAPDKADIINADGGPSKNPSQKQRDAEAVEAQSHNTQNGVVGRAPVTSRESSNTVPKQGRASLDNEVIVPKAEPSSPSSVSSTSAKENSVIANKTNHESALRAVENQSVAKKKTAHEKRCPHPKCKAIVAEADIPQHLKSVHDLHLCECGEVKTSLQKLENHRKTCVMNPTTPQSSAPAPVQSTGKRHNSQNSNPGEPSEKRLKSNTNPRTLSSANASNVTQNESIKSSSNQTNSGRASSRTRKSAARIISSDEDAEDGDATDSVQGSRQVSPGSVRSPRRGGCAYKCTKCGQEFSRQSALDSHTKAYHTKNSDEFVCDDCGEEFSSEKKLDLHYKKGGRQGCNKKIMDSDYEPEDSSRSPSKEPGSGKSGNESSGGKSTVLNSKVSNTSKNVLSTQSTATSVIATTATPDAAPGGTPNASTPADTRTVQPTVVAPPTVVIPPTVTTTRLCNFCNTPFPDKLDLAYHLLKHNEEYGKDKSGSFSFLADGINKQVKCVVCGGAFQKRSDMIAHLQAYHHKTGTYPCAECHQKFTEASVLLSHCDEKHPAMSGLTSANMRTATHHANSNKSNEYICPVMDCRKKHSTLPDLNEHHKTAHPERPWFVCPLTDCNAPYATEKSLNRHLQKEHNMGPFRRFVR